MYGTFQHYDAITGQTYAHEVASNFFASPDPAVRLAASVGYDFENNDYVLYRLHLDTGEITMDHMPSLGSSMMWLPDGRHLLVVSSVGRAILDLDDLSLHPIDFGLYGTPLIEVGPYLISRNYDMYASTLHLLDLQDYTTRILTDTASASWSPYFVP